MSSGSGGGDGGRSKKKAKRAYFKRAGASQSHSNESFDPVHSNCQFLIITADQGKERQCGHEMAAWCSDIVQEKFPEILAAQATTSQTTDPPSTSASASASASVSTSASSAGSSATSQPISTAVSISDELDQELRVLQQNDGKKRRRHDLYDGPSEHADDDDDADSEDDNNMKDEKSAEKGEKPRKAKKVLSGPKESIFAVSPGTVKVRGVVVVALNHPLLSANALFEQLFSDVLDRGRISCRLSIRCFPVLSSCFARMDSFEKLCQKVIPSSFQNFPSSGTFSIVVNRRGNNSQMNRDDIIKMIAAMVPKSYSVNLSCPNIFIIVELIERMAAVGCMKNNEKIPNFNLRKAHEIYLQKNTSNVQTMKIKAQTSNTNNNQQQQRENNAMKEEKDQHQSEDDAQADTSTETDSVANGESRKFKKAKIDLSS